MEEIVDRIEYINILINSLDDNDKTTFIQKNTDCLEQLNQQICQLEASISQFAPSEQKVQEFGIENKRNLLISKCLFPQYWILDEMLKKYTHDQLTEFEKTLF